ncbi:MAG: Cys-tRNA(Pro) deacylase [Candidatus Competibacteraceae bacterium]|nr:Cys-tRNA(Pro) deacylase [Candidatus Competibacteraceae bacterium]MBK7983024.1 Cys-tRNA(Pro) deacylase [Candidatus Competibacteraceae bacterium]MBK8898424.1 Cys-tRNA(Pro) deacylase [Candidatus Competibacteraceae bacterium]MBK8962234.1 Cys-tRNA(Pro) deacylase [Candidatus Competibacteraceae bacterium]MBK9951449.1 Cys-tRNA(Pro) deacylase [Candidatus Competibacteraceae bacterium]
MSKEKFPVTPATRVLHAHDVAFSGHLYSYQERGGTAHSARCLGVHEHAIIKTLIMENDRRQPLIVLMHGDRQVSTKELARALGAKSITPCDPAVANKHSGYFVGGTSPFGTRKAMPVYLEASILELPLIYLNGGKRGFLVSLSPGELQRLLAPTLVDIAIAD